MRPYAEVFLEKPRPQAKHPAALEIRVMQAEYAHEIAVLTYAYSDALLSAARKGKPVTVRWGWRPETTEFVGYVHHTVVDQKPDRKHQRQLRIVCIGATEVLNQPAFQQYRAARADAVVSEIVRRNQLSILTERHNYIWPLLQQQGESTWFFLVACAKRIGWTLYAHGTDVRHHSRVIRYSGAVAFRAFATGFQDERGAIHVFDTVQAETLSVGARKRARIVRGVDSTGTLFTVHADLPGALAGVRAADLKLTEYVTTPATSIAEAQAIVAGEQEANRHHINAKATVTGDARVHAASTVRLLSVDNDNDGFWYTTRAEHIITGSSYVLRLELGRDSVGDPTNARLMHRFPGETVNRSVVHRGVGASVASQDRTAPAARWINQRWQSAAALERDLPAVARPAPVRAAPAVLQGVFKA